MCTLLTTISGLTPNTNDYSKANKVALTILLAIPSLTTIAESNVIYEGLVSPAFGPTLVNIMRAQYKANYAVTITVPYLPKTYLADPVIPSNSANNIQSIFMVVFSIATLAFYLVL